MEQECGFSKAVQEPYRKFAKNRKISGSGKNAGGEGGGSSRDANPTKSGRELLTSPTVDQNLEVGVEQEELEAKESRLRQKKNRRGEGHGASDACCPEHFRAKPAPVKPQDKGKGVAVEGDEEEEWPP